MIEVTASAAAFLKNPDRPGTGESGHLMPDYMPALVQESPGSEPQRRMLRLPRGSSFMIFGNNWEQPISVYQRHGDGSLRHVPEVEAE